MAKRRSGGWLTSEVGGMPMWGILVAVAALMVLSAVSVTAYVGALNGASSPEEIAADQQRSQDLLEKYASEQEQKEAEAEYNSRFHITMPDDEPLRIFFAADSLGAGYHASTMEQGYRWLVEDYFEQFGAVESSAGTKDADEPLFQVGNIQGVPESGIDVAVVELGTNDAERTDLVNFRSQYRELLRSIRSGSPDAAIVCVGLWGYEGVVRNYDSIISQVCAQEGGKYVSIKRYFAQEGTIGPEGRDTWIGPADAFHPNDLGHQLIADRILSVLTVD